MSKSPPCIVLRSGVGDIATLTMAMVKRQAAGNEARDLRALASRPSRFTRAMVFRSRSSLSKVMTRRGRVLLMKNRLFFAFPGNKITSLGELSGGPQDPSAGDHRSVSARSTASFRFSVFAGSPVQRSILKSPSIAGPRKKISGRKHWKNALPELPPLESRGLGGHRENGRWRLPHGLAGQEPAQGAVAPSTARPLRATDSLPNLGKARTMQSGYARHVPYQ